MKINEVEQAIGITKKNIRFYEAEGLLSPSRSANGYRDYSPEDVEALNRIKLFRKLDIPLEEIKRLQSGSLTLEDCLKRHLIVLERRAKNLEAANAFCRRLLAEDAQLSSLPVEQLLTEMKNMEEGGTKFVDIRKKDKKARKQGAIIGALAAISLMALFLGICVWGLITDPEMPVIVAVFLLVFPTVVIVCTLFVLRERLKEIEGGELDEASKY